MSSDTCSGITDEFLITACHLRRDYQKMRKFELIGIYWERRQIKRQMRNNPNPMPMTPIVVLTVCWEVIHETWQRPVLVQ